ncbi:MAG: N-acetyltransferase family protein [Pseudomonadota bacterium]
MEIEIRPAEDGNLSDIGRVWNRMIGETLSTFTTAEKSRSDLTDWIRRQRDAGRPVLVIRVDGGFGGFATYGPFRSGPGYRHTMEHTILMEDRCQGTGAARRLLEALEAEAHRAGVRQLIAGISAENPRAIAFHTRATSA